MVQEAAGVDVDRVPSGGLHDRHAHRLDMARDILGGSDPVAQVVFFDDFLQAHGDRFEVAPREPAIRREPLGEDQPVAAVHSPVLEVHRQPTADVRQAVFLGAHRAAVRVREHFADDLDDRDVRVAVFALLDEPGVLGEAAGVDEQWNAVAVADLARGADVFHRNRLPAARVIGHGQHAQWNVVHAMLFDEALQLGDIHVALERVLRGGVPTLVDHQVNGGRALGLDVGTRGVEVCVIGDDVVGFGHHREQDAFRRPALVGGYQVLERHQALDRLLETVKRWAAGIGLVALHDRAPLAGAHAGGARVGQQVDQHVVRVQGEEVVPGIPDQVLALLARGHPDRLDGLDAERFDDRLVGGVHFDSCRGSAVVYFTRRRAKLELALCTLG